MDEQINALIFSHCEDPDEATKTSKCFEIAV